MDVPKDGFYIERAVSSIPVGNRHRKDLGEIDTLAASIDRHVLLQPITVNLDGFLICGARRLTAIKKLGWKTVRVWVRSGISDRLGQLLAEQDEKFHTTLTELQAFAEQIDTAREQVTPEERGKRIPQRGHLRAL